MAAKPETKAKAEKPAAATKETKEKAPVKTKTAVKAKADAVGDTVNSREDAKTEKKHHHTHVERKDRHCEVKSCKREYRAKGYCNAHYKKWRQGEYGHRRYTSCSTASCNKPQNKNRHGYCEDHYQSYYVKGMAVAKEVIAEATPKKVEKTAAA